MIIGNNIIIIIIVALDHMKNGIILFKPDLIIFFACKRRALNFFFLQIANFNDIYHFALRGAERARAPTDTPYTTKSNSLKSEHSVSCITYNYFIIIMLADFAQYSSVFP